MFFSLGVSNCVFYFNFSGNLSSHVESLCVGEKESSVDDMSHLDEQLEQFGKEGSAADGLQVSPSFLPSFSQLWLKKVFLVLLPLMKWFVRF